MALSLSHDVVAKARRKGGEGMVLYTYSCFSREPGNGTGWDELEWMGGAVSWDIFLVCGGRYPTGERGGVERGFLQHRKVYYMYIGHRRFKIQITQG